MLKSKADIKRLPIGTKLRLVHCLIGPTDKLRTIQQVRSNDILMLTEDGKTSYLTLGGEFKATEKGFQLWETTNRGKEIAAEYILES